MADLNFREDEFADGVATIKAALETLRGISAPKCVDAGDEIQAALQGQYDAVKADLVDGVATRIEQDIASLEAAGANYAASLRNITSSLGGGDAGTSTLNGAPSAKFTQTHM